MNQTITIHDLPPGLNGKGGLKRMHHHQYAKIRDSWHYQILAEKPSKHKGKVRITYTRYSTHVSDPDNVAASFKVVGDGLVSNGVLKDDSFDVITDFIVRWEKVKSKAKQRIEVEIQDIND